MKFEDKPDYNIGEKLHINDKECEIISKEYNRDYSNPFRPDYKDGTEYEVRFSNGGLMNGLRWWNFDEGKAKNSNQHICL